MNKKEIEQTILEVRSGLKTDRLDMSFGEIMSIYESDDLIIKPEYQRAYRWSNEQKTRFIESVLLGIPIPPIFVAEDEEGKWELVDGLQRISTILSFFGALKNDYDKKNYFKLGKTDLTNNILDTLDIDQFSTKLKLTIKRAVCRIEILRWDSKFDMRYELFNRLNTGSSPLKEQEVRNCVFSGEFNNLLIELAKYPNFINILKPTPKQKEEMVLEEMVLRYFSTKTKYKDLYISNNIKQHLTSYMNDINSNILQFDYKKEKKDFIMIIDFLYKNKISKPFKSHKGKFSVSIYETVMVLVFKFLSKYPSGNINKFKQIKNNLLQDDDFQKYAGFKTSGKERLAKKMTRAEEILNA